MRKYKILQITKGKFPPEIRVVKEGLALFEAGYGSAVLCPPFDNQPEYEIWNGIEIYRPKILGQRSSAEKVFEQITLFSPAWYKAIKDTISIYSPHALHIHDIWLGRVVFAACDSEKIVLDLHENMPAAVVEYVNGYRGLQRLFRKVFHSYHRIFAYERKLVMSSDMVLVVVQEARERVLINHPGLSSLKVVNVENLESKRFLTKSQSGKVEFKKDHFSVLYIGGFGPHRGVDTLIRAMSVIKESGRNIKVQLIGAVPSQFLEMLKELIFTLEVENYVQITGWVSAEDVLANILQADLCCVPHHSNPHTNNTIPHKLFQYMIAKRPVLVSSSTPLARTVSQANAGLIFDAGDFNDCAIKIMRLADNPNACLNYAENGHRYVLQQGHNWEDESAPKLVESYDLLFSNIKN